MMDLILEYLIVFILLFVTNIAFLLRKSNFNGNKFILFLLIYGAIVFILSLTFSSLSFGEYIIPIMPYILGLISLLMLVFAIRFVSFGGNFNILDDKVVFYGTILSSFISITTLSLCLKSDNLVLSSLELAVLSVIVMFLVYKISRIFDNAKRPYYAVIGEYMFLEFIFLLILALTFSTVRELDYSIFESFIILTPTYQLMYMIIIILIILVLGVLYSDWTFKRLKRK
ncbi:hypothetical protein [Methanobrevibacter olleyae]|uniref:Uncharacterized protein n=1 Tax=Methanobrevibacter olleyae TaxID=294671 RepID=A0A126QXL8_METOL|nr:hypothetical protein [Methanobrevibacter olleyae]AMK14586.1 hypothetical protein YLM1_0026 [Methanobrevibacter olleyae]SFL27597.1 hypothetical protein SAMN02910297_00427 [Methanobrevibacter olleyae]